MRGPATANPLYVPTDVSRAPKPRTDRPARQQITEEPKEEEDNVVGEYNIWYHRHLGYDAKTAKATTRVNVTEDTGMTTANLTTASICLNFARGNCIKGYKCHWKHQVPTEDDELRVSMLKDVFGRGRHGTDKEEMDGTGNFNKNNRTIYLGGVVSKEDQRETERAIKGDFGAFGELEYVRVIPSKAIAFVRFKLRVAAEFAREAMNGQAVPYGQLSCKWAHVDPNPLAKEFDRRADEALAQYAIAKRVLEMSQEKRAAWSQVHQVQNGQYPVAAATAAVAAALPAAGGEEPQEAAGSDAGPSGALPPPPPPAGIDPARAQAFSAYWANFHAQKAAQRLGVEAPLPAAAVAPAAEAEAATAESSLFVPPPPPPPVLTNPHTGETVDNKGFALNPYSQAPHPYAYRDYGWNRPKKGDKDREQKRLKREQEEALRGDGYDPQQDPNHSYGPSAAAAASAQGRAAKRAGGPQAVTVGRAAAVGPGAAAAPAVAMLPKGKGKVVASREEAEALMNDEPLAFN